MPDVTGPDSGHTFAIRNEEQYQSAPAVADQRIAVQDGDGRNGLLACYASRPLDQPGSALERLVVVVHGALRDSDRYFAHAGAAAGDSGPATLIVAPQFLAQVDLRTDTPGDILYWDVEGWKGGESAAGPERISSFTAMDCLLRQLTAPDRWAGDTRPSVVIVGNSAGGQYVNRYAAVGRGPDYLAKRGISVRFVIANPSTYLYFDRERPVPVPDQVGVNQWRYGFDTPPPYVEGTAQESLRRYLARDVTIVLGAEDSNRAALLLEVSAAAMAQGANRLERGINYDGYVRRRAAEAGLTTRHRLIQLAGVGHAACDVLAATETRQLLLS
jgi:hypothetical protein